MGIIEKKLSEFELSTGQEVHVELNEAGKVHMHIGNIQLKFTRSEFVVIGDALEEALKEFNNIKNKND